MFKMSFSSIFRAVTLKIQRPLTVYAAILLFEAKKPDKTAKKGENSSFFATISPLNASFILILVMNCVIIDLKIAFLSLKSRKKREIYEKASYKRL